jgi:hypothetical protein
MWKAMQSHVERMDEETTVQTLENKKCETWKKMGGTAVRL